MPDSLSGLLRHSRRAWLCAAVTAVGLPLIASAAQAQSAAPAVAPAAAAATPDPGASSGFDLSSVQSLLARGDAAAAAGNLAEARRLYEKARDASKYLQSAYRSISGAFRGLDARIPREMDDKGRQAYDLWAQSNMRLVALLRREGQHEVAVPLLVEVITLLTPSSEQGRKAYQQLLEIGFVSTPYGAGSAN